MRQWYCHTQEGTQFGPIEESDLVTLFHGGHLAPDALVWTEELGEWVAAVDVQGLVPEEILAAFGNGLVESDEEALDVIVDATPLDQEPTDLSGADVDGPGDEGADPGVDQPAVAAEEPEPEATTGLDGVPPAPAAAGDLTIQLFEVPFLSGAYYHAIFSPDAIYMLWLSYQTPHRLLKAARGLRIGLPPSTADTESAAEAERVHQAIIDAATADPEALIAANPKHRRFDATTIRKITVRHTDQFESTPRLIIAFDSRESGQGRQSRSFDCYPFDSDLPPNLVEHLTALYGHCVETH